MEEQREATGRQTVLCGGVNESVSVYRFYAAMSQNSEPLHVSYNLWTAGKTDCENVVSLGIPVPVFSFFFPLVSKHRRVQDILSTDPQDLQKSFNHQQDLHCVPLVDAVSALLLPLAPFINLLLIYKSQPKPVFTVRSLSQLYIWFLLLPLECWVLYVNPQINMHRFYLISQLVEWL